MPRFVLHEHDAIRKGKHWDLRFEIPNSKNWASFVFNKFPPLKPAERVYVPRAPDHSEVNALFVGEIKEGEYGAGKLTEVDSGDCDIHKYTNSHIVIDFKGKKIKGVYHFVSTSVFGKKNRYSKKVYAFFKGKL